MLFAVKFIIDRIPFKDTIPGSSEILFGLIGIPFGFLFIDGVIVNLSIRLLEYFSILFNYVLYFVISYYDKNKFVDCDRQKIAPVAQ